MISEEHEGYLDDIYIVGSNVLQKEIDHAKSIPSHERVLIRKDSSLLELQQKDQQAGENGGKEGVQSPGIYSFSNNQEQLL